jgi:drug/metabolite transporter (DMT)-like permease
LSVLALLLVLLSALLHASWNAATRRSRNPTAFLLAMELASLAFFAPVWLLGFDLGDVPGALWPLLLGTAATHACYALWLSRAYTYGELSLVYPIARSTPAFVPLLAVPLLGERVSLVGGLGIALVVAGMWAVQSDGRLALRGLGSRAARFAYLTLAATVAYSLLDKQAMELLSSQSWRGPLPRGLAYMALFQPFYLALFFLLGARSASPGEVLSVARAEGRLALGGAAVAIASYVLILEAYRLAPVSYVVAVRQVSVLFALAISAVVLREGLSRARGAGALATVLGVALIARYA